MRHPAVALVFAGAAVVATGVILLVLEVRAYLEDYRGIDSDAGLFVFRLDGVLVSYPPFEVSPTLTIIAVGTAMMVGALLVGAVTWRRPSRAA